MVSNSSSSSSTGSNTPTTSIFVNISHSLNDVNSSKSEGNFSVISASTSSSVSSSEASQITELIPISNDCDAQNAIYFHDSYFGVPLAVPEWEAILTAIILSVIIVLTIVGNVLVILSVFTYKPLRIVQNFFIVSLAVADLTVALLVLPFNVAYSILGRWEFGIHLCKMWLTCDVMCCTSSILNLCAIALDRYWAITDPINYAQKRTVTRVLILIAGVWLLSLLISSPPLIGWNDWPEEFTSATPCELTSNRGYVIYSSLGSFFIPLVIMTIVYIEIFVATRRRLRERARASKMNTITMKSIESETATKLTLATAPIKERTFTTCSSMLCCLRNTSQSSTDTMIQNDPESFSSETYANNESHHQALEHKVVIVAQRRKSKRSKIKDSIKHSKARGRRQPMASNAERSQTRDREADREADRDKEGDEKNEGTERLLLPTSTCTNSKIIDSKEVSTESGSDPKASIEICSAADIVDNIIKDPTATLTIDGKMTPSQSSLGAGTNTNTAASLTPQHNKRLGVYQFIEEKQKISLSKERRAARTLGIIMGVFVICWVPFFLMYVILPFCESCCPTNKFKNFITWLGYINSGLNPVIYTIFNLDYRRAFKRLLGIK